MCLNWCTYRNQKTDMALRGFQENRWYEGGNGYWNRKGLWSEGWTGRLRREYEEG